MPSNSIFTELARSGLLDMFLARHPEMIDAVHPHTPFNMHSLIFGRLDAVALNPQPLPPRELVGAMSAVAQLAGQALQGRDFRQFAEDIDDWCKTGWPRWIPKPRGPLPEPWKAELGLFFGAVAVAAIADTFDAGEQKEAFDRAAAQLGSAAFA